jgi:AcrR family transcriptional regulator
VTQPLTEAQILSAAEEVLRRHGPAKANVVDVARTLGVSHGSVYRHFPSKQALREAVTRRWLHGFVEALAPIVVDDRPDKLRRWLHALFDAKREQALEDPELFATYQVLLADSSDVVDEHVEALVGQLTDIVSDPFRARAIFDATTRFHHPAHAADWGRSDMEVDLEHVIELIDP